MLHLALVLLLYATTALALWPLPKTLHTGSSAILLSPNFDIKLPSSYPTDLHEAVQRTKEYLSTDKLERLVVGRGEADSGALKGAKLLSKLSLSLTPTLSINARSIAQEAQLPFEDRDEGYTLIVPANGSNAHIFARTSLGLFRGLTTFSQLWYHHPNGTIYALDCPITIVDSPAYPYRGLLLDTSRNFFPVVDIKRTLDAMSWVKMNTFHWHIVDSQSFPLQVPGFEELSAKGAYSANEIYTTEDVREIVSYAGARGIDVQVEIDTPGHTAIIGESHPEHIACAQATPWSSFADEPPAGQLRLAEPSTIKFTASLIHATSLLFPSKYFSTGGDEINIPCYDQDGPTQATLNSTGQTLEQALSTFIQSTHEPLRANGKTVVVWEDIVLAHNVKLANDTIVMVWRKSENVKNVVEKGYRVIHSAFDYFYLDCGHGDWLGNSPEGNSWCDPYKTWQLTYTFNPLADLTESESSLILGGQHVLWAEQASPTSLDSYLWPRAASSAELFWTGPDNGMDVKSALPRLHDIAFRMTQRGVGAVALQPLWCALRPGACDLTEKQQTTILLENPV